MTEIPARIKVGPYRVRVSTDLAKLAGIRAEMHDQRIGNFTTALLEITVDPTLAPDQLAETVLHETLHACFEVVGGCRGKYDAEGWIQFVAPTLLAVLRENPALVAYLLTEEEDDAREGHGPGQDDEQTLRGAEAAPDRPGSVRLGQHEGGQGDHERGEGQGQEALRERP